MKTPLDENQKYGVVLMIMSFFLVLLTLMISKDSLYWEPRSDYIDYIVNRLHIRFFWDPINSSDPFSEYLIDIPARYVILAFMGTAAYGYTTYLGITSAFKPWKKPSED